MAAYRDKIIDPGEMNYEINVHNYSMVTKPNGEQVLTHAEWNTVWAKIEWGSEAERFEADQEVNVYDGKATIRFLTGIDEKMLLEIDSEFFDILAIQQDPSKRFHFLKIRKRK